MDRSELTIAIAVILLVTFSLGWFMRWFFDRLNSTKPLASDEAMQRLQEAEERLMLRENEFSATEAQYANAYAQLEAELDAAMAGLGESRREAARLRAIIDEKS